MIAINKTDITAGLERESSLLSVNMTDGNNVSLYDMIFIDNDSVLAGVVNEAVNNLTQNMQMFVTAFDDTTDDAYKWTLTKEPIGIRDDILNYIVNYTMNEWCVRALGTNKTDTYAGRAAASLQNVARKLYFKSCPV